MLQQKLMEIVVTVMAVLDEVVVMIRKVEVVVGMRVEAEGILVMMMMTVVVVVMMVMLMTAVVMKMTRSVHQRPAGEH